MKPFCPIPALWANINVVLLNQTQNFLPMNNSICKVITVAESDTTLSQAQNVSLAHSSQKSVVLVIAIYTMKWQRLNWLKFK